MDRKIAGGHRTVIRRNVLIFHSGGLGDFVLTWPLGLALGRLHPQSRIIYVTHASKGELAAKSLRLDWLDSEAGWPALYSSEPRELNDRISKTLAQTHSVYTFLSSAEDAFCGNVRSLAPEAALTSLRLTPPAGWTGHVSDHLLHQLSRTPAVRTAVEQILVSIASKGIATVRHGKGPILIHPGSGGREKCLPVGKFVEIAKNLSEAGRRAKFLIGEVELERFSAQEIGQLEKAAPMGKPMKYVDLLNEINDASGFIGNDSGPGHLAGIMGCPTISLFGPTDPAVWRPLGPRVGVLRRGNPADLEADGVSRALEQLMETSM
jgi:ADP-heptose:LPS heptosyltransferase